MIKNNKALIIGSGPIRIGQACEFDYSGTQACKALKELGYNIILINSNPATIMTDPSTADKTYICPLTYENAVKIIKKERPNYILTSFGGQTALNLATQLYNNGILQKYKVQVAGTSIESISESEDRIKFKNKMSQIQIKTPYAYICNSVDDIKNTKFPVLVRSSFALGGNNSKMFQSLKDLKNFIQHNTGEHLVEESILGWQELEVEVVRDYTGNKIVVCYIENIDPVGVHTGDSICVSPFYTVPTNIQNQIKKQAFRIVDGINLIGACNVQFAYNKKTKDLCVIEINARTSRSSALASKATGFPIAYIATKLVMGIRLDEIPYKYNKTLLDYKPGNGYYAVKYPKFNMEKFDTKDHDLGVTMKAVGEVLAFGKTVKEAIQKAKDSISGKSSKKSKKYWHRIPVATDPNKYYYYSSILKGKQYKVSNNKKIIVIGSGPNRIGQGIEFDYCCVHAVQTFKKMGYEVIMVNSNPETVSTDYDIADKLYFEPITVDNIMAIYNLEQPEYIVTNFGGQTALNILKQLDLSKVKVLGINDNILNKTEDRYEFYKLMQNLKIPTPYGKYIKTKKEALAFIKEIGFPVIVRPSYIIGGSGVKIINTEKELLNILKISNGMYVDQMMKDCLECEVDVLSDGKESYFVDVIEQIDKSGIHSGDSRSILPNKHIKRSHIKQIKEYTDKIIRTLNIKGILNIQFIIKDKNVYVIEVNPRSSRTVPIVSKTYNFDMIGAAISLMLGATIKEIKKPKKHIKYYSYKEPIFSWSNFPNTKPKLGPEMFSTGEELKFIKNRKTIIKPLQKLYK